MPKLKVTLSIGFANAKREDIIDIDETAWAECETEEERDELMEEYWQAWSSNYIDGGCWLVDGEGKEDAA